MKTASESSIRVVKSTYYSNWGDRFGYPLARLFVRPLAQLSFVTPNHVTVVSFLLFAFGSFLLYTAFSYHLIVGAFLIVAGYVGDDIDGQLARLTGKSSIIGDFLDKVLDVFKIFLITFFTGLSVYATTGDITYILLGFAACFFFMMRYYIKLETMYSAYSRNEKYFAQSSEKRLELEHEMDITYAKKAGSLREALHLFWTKNRTILFVDEAEFAIFISLGAIFNRLDISLWVIASIQALYVFYRFYERGHQLQTTSKDLLKPLRK